MNQKERMLNKLPYKARLDSLEEKRGKSSGSSHPFTLRAATPDTSTESPSPSAIMCGSAPGVL